MRVKIKTPIWNGKKVGIANKKILTNDTDNILVEILYKNKYGDRIYPYPYRIIREKALSYPIQTRYGIDLRIIPIRDMEEIHHEMV